MNRFARYIAFFALLGSVACSNQRLLLSSEEGALLELLETDTAFEHPIRPDDKLSLSVWNHDDLSMGSVFSIYNSNESFGKWVLVNAEGYAQLPKIGPVRLAGMTCGQAADTLRSLYGKHITNPIVVVKTLNRKVTVLGEVRTPGSYVMEEERVDIMQIIGRAQGFTDYANIKNVRLIRNDISYTLDLRSMDEYLLHNIIIQSGDVVIVSARKGKALDQKAPTLIPFSSALTAVALVVSILLAS